MNTVFDTQSIVPNFDHSIPHFKQIERFNDSIVWWFDFSFPTYLNFIIKYINQAKETKSSLIRAEILVLIVYGLQMTIDSAPEHPSLKAYINIP
jgi:hypothetical protein